MHIARRMVTALLLAGASVFAWGQETTPVVDDLLDRYALATDALEEAIRVLPEDASAARDAVDLASNALPSLTRGSNVALSESLDSIVLRARVAIDNRSVTDLRVQVEVLRGGLRRVVYEASIADSLEGRGSRAVERLAALANDMAFAPDVADAISAAAGPTAAREAFDAALRARVDANLAAIAEDTSSDPTIAYPALASAYAEYVVVKDVGGIDPVDDGRFVQAAQALVAGDDSAFRTEVEALRQEVAALLATTDDVAALSDGPPADATVTDVGDATQTTEATESGATTVVVELDEEAERARERAEAEAALAARIERERQEAVTSMQSAIADATLAGLADQLRTIGVAEDRIAVVAERLAARGIDDVHTAANEIGAAISSLQAYVVRGETVAARAAIDALTSLYADRFGAVVREASSAHGDAFVAELGRIASSPTVRTSDVARLASAHRAVLDAFEGRPPSQMHGALATVAGWWNGVSRSATAIVLALLALVPLRLLTLAFGTANPHWRRVSWALVLLLLPVFVEGIAALAGLIGAWTGTTILSASSVASPFENDLSTAAWSAVWFLALVLASIGLYGICVQFGVVGPGAARRSAATSVTATQSGTEKAQTDTVLDWEEEF